MSYCADADLDALFGAANVKKWADLDNDADAAKIAARKAAAREYADEYLDDRLRPGPVTLPVSTVSVTLKDAAARVAGIWLYESRGHNERLDSEDEPPVDRMAIHRRHVEKFLRDVNSGAIRLNAPYTGTGYPGVYVDTNEE